MKIKKIAFAPVQPKQQAQPVQPAIGQPATGQALTEALNPQMRTLFNKALQGTGLSKQKVLPFLEQLFTALGDVPLSKITGVIKALNAEETQTAQTTPAQATQTPDTGVVGQETQTMVPASG